jgi:hypothetical protein
VADGERAAAATRQRQGKGGEEKKHGGTLTRWEYAWWADLQSEHTKDRNLTTTFPCPNCDSALQLAHFRFSGSFFRLFSASTAAMAENATPYSPTVPSKEGHQPPGWEPHRHFNASRNPLVGFQESLESIGWRGFQSPLASTARIPAMRLAVVAVAAVAALAAYANAECANACSGHGICSTSDQCDCFPNYRAADCSERTFRDGGCGLIFLFGCNHSFSVFWLTPSFREPELSASELAWSSLSHLDEPGPTGVTTADPIHK